MRTFRDALSCLLNPSADQKHRDQAVVVLRGLDNQRQRYERQIDDCYIYLETGAVHPLVAQRIREMELLVYLQVAANTIGGLQAQVSADAALRTEVEELRRDLARAKENAA